VKLWDVSTRLELLELDHNAPVHALAFSPDGQLLATGDAGNRGVVGGAGGGVRLWRAPRNR
jgi:WD40 repeat protein